MTFPLPKDTMPIAWVTINGVRYPAHVEPAWSKAFGSINGRSAAQADDRATAAVAVVQANAAALAAVVAQNATNAAAIAQTTTVLQAASIPGASGIPPADNGAAIPPVDPGMSIP